MSDTPARDTLQKFIDGANEQEAEEYVGEFADMLQIHIELANSESLARSADAHERMADAMVRIANAVVGEFGPGSWEELYPSQS